jgi:hypothetical protein
MDETFSAQAIQYRVGEFVEFLSNEAGMGPWYICLWLWARLTGFSGEWLRLWSVIGAAISITLFQLVLKRHVGTSNSSRHWIGPGLFFLVCHPSFLLAMTEARAYSWMVTGAVASLLLLHRLKEDPGTGRLLALTVCVGVSSGLHPVSLYFQATVLAVALIFTQPMLPMRYLVASSGLATALALPFYLVTLRSGANQTSWIGPLTFERIARALTNYLGAVPGAFLMAPLLLVSFLQAVRSRHEESPSLAGRIDHFQTEILIGVPIGLLLAQSFVVNGFSGRYLTPLVPVLALGALKGCRTLASRLDPRWHRSALFLISLVTVIGLPQELLLRERNRGGEYRELAEVLGQVDWTDRQLVIPDPTLAQGTWFYASNKLRVAFHPQPDDDPRPWDKFEHIRPAPKPTACTVVILDARSGEELSGLLTDYFGADWSDEVDLGAVTVTDGVEYTEIPNSGC